MWVDEQYSLIKKYHISISIPFQPLFFLPKSSYQEELYNTS